MAEAAQLADETALSRIDDLCEAVVDCPHSTPVWTDTGALVLRSQNIRNGRLDLSTKSFTDEAHYRDRSKRAEVRAGDLVITREAPMGEVCMIPPGLRCCLGQRMVLLRPNALKCDGRYLLYALQSPGLLEQISWSEGTGSTVSNLRIPHLKALRVPTPHKKEQQQIGSTLGALDDKIEQNRRTAQSLEQLARAIFRAWFVDFEPVKAKAAGATAFPSMPQPVFDALPIRFVDSDIGRVPEGWEAKALSAICTLVSGGTPKRSEAAYWDGDIPWFSVKDAPGQGELWVLETSERISADGLADSAARVVPKGCTIISARGTVGQLALAGVPMAFNQSCYGLLPGDGKSFGYLHLLMQSVVAELQQRTHGSVFDTITRTTFDGLLVTSPRNEVVSAFEAVIDPLLALLLESADESMKLAAMRDYLLPKLLSGDIQVELTHE